MDVLRFLALLPLRLLRLVSGWLAATGRLLRPAFGTFSWSAPPWMPALTRRVRAQPRQFGGGAAALVVVVGGAIGIWQWYLHRPHPPEPERITLAVHTPAITDYEQAHPVVHPLEVTFSASAAPLELVGKTVTRGISMDPALRGSWSWTDDRTLRFTPAFDWPVGLHADVQFDVATAFARHVLMASDHVAFDMPQFAAKAGESEFYQDPQNPIAKKTIMGVAFNYPVDPVSLERHVSLALKGRGAGEDTPLKFTVIYDPARLKAFIHSQPLELPRDDDSVVMTLDSGVASSRGGAATSTPLHMSVRVPGLYSLTLADVKPTLVDNDRYEPEQVIVSSASDAVRGSDLAAIARAWVLPKRRAGVKQANDAPPYEWQMSDVGDAVLRTSQPIKLELVPTENEFAELQSFKFHAQPGQRVFIRFASGLKSFGGYILGKPNSQTFTVPDYPKLLRFMADGSLLSLSGDRRVSIVSRNEPGMKLEIGRVLPGQLQHLVSFNEGSFAKPDLNSNFSEDHIVERFAQTAAFPHGSPGDAHYEGADLGQYLKEGKHGVFLLHLAEWDPAKAQKKNDSEGDSDSDSDSSSDSDQSPTDTRLIVITDLGVLAKRSLDGSRTVFVQSIHGGDPVGGANVAIVALNGESLFSQVTSADGVVSFPSLKGLEHERQPVMYVVTKGDDLSFLPVAAEDRKLDYSRFDIGGETNPTSESALSGYLFSDRGIYRPGDLMHVGIIVRTADWSHNAVGIPLQAEIVDPRGVVARKLPVQVDSSGFTSLDYTPAETAPTGTWTINLYIIGKDNEETAIGSTTVSVKEFLPDSMKVEANLSSHVADGWVKPDKLKGLVDARNLFGTPAANRRVAASLTLNPTFDTFHAWPNYQFYDVRHAKDGYTTKLQDGRTDEKGHAEFDLDLKKYADATYRLDFLAKVFEPEGGRSVAATASTLVSSNSWLVGYKSADDLSYVRRGNTRSVHLVAIDPQTKPIELKGLTAQLIERRYVSVLTKEQSGVYKYESRLKEIPVSSAPISIPAGGLDYTLPTDKPGDWALLIRSGNVSANRIEYSVTGAANVSRSLERNAELEINLDKHDYAPGESIEISLRAPYPGSGLITIERDKVYAHAWFTSRTTNSVQHIAVPPGFEGNGYINVQYIRDPSSNEIFMSPLSYGVAPFSVNVDARRNALTLEAPELVKPGTTATFHLHAAHPSKAVVFAVDEGILQVARYKLGDPLAYFFRKRMLEVQTSQILDLILPEFKTLMSLSAPGGDQSNAIGRQLNPFKRRREKPVAYWSGIIDVNGDATVQYAVPDYFHGQMRVMAVAVSSDLIGTAEAATTVHGDFTLSPDAPTTLAPGDEADVGVGVSNNLTGAGSNTVPVAVTLKAGPQFQIIGSAVQNLALASMHEGVVKFHVRATDTLGSGTLAFTAGYGGKAATQSIDVSIRPAAAFRTQLDIARIGPSDNKVFPNLRHMYDAYSRRDASVSTVPLVLTQALTSWLVNYDNYCSEQIVSAAMPRLVAAKWSSVPGISRALKPVLGSKSEADALATQIEALRSRQNDQGGFGLWTATPDAEPFVSAYAMHFLIEARDRGIAVPKEMLDSGNTYLQQLAANEGLNALDEIRQRAYAVYVLTRQGNVTTNALASVQKRLQDAYPKTWKNDLAAAWLAASYKLLKEDKEADALIAPLQKTLERTQDDQSYEWEYYDDPLTRDATVLYLLARHFPERSLSPRVMENITRPLARNEFNTLSAAMTMLAIDAYAKNNSAAIDKLKIEEIEANGQTRSIASPQNKLLQAGSWDNSAARLKFTNESAQPAWLVVDQAGYDRDVPNAAIKNGIEIVRDYTDLKGKPLTNITVGDEIDVHVKIRATAGKGEGDIAIVDLFPGGFEPVTGAAAENSASGDNSQSGPSLAAAGSSWRPTYADIREDRVVIYGSATPDVQEFVYKIKAAAAGRFTVPAAYGESLYDRRVQARAPGGDVLTVVAAH